MDDRTLDMPATHATNTTVTIQDDQSINLQEKLFRPWQRSLGNDCDLWRDYWRTKNQPWRTEPEIDAKRQVTLNQYRVTIADSERGCYPFKDIDSKLRRADVEWLLASNVEGLVERSSVSQRERSVLDLRGADMRKVRLRGLPLARLRGGLTSEEWVLATDHQRDMAAVHLERADLRGAHLEGAELCGAHLEGADLRGAHLEGADLGEAHLEGNEDYQKPADLRMAVFDNTTNLAAISLGNETYGFVPLADVYWGNVNLTNVDWTGVNKLGDEYETQWKLPIEYQAAIRANRQLARALQAQGMNEEAAHFIYRANVNKRFMRLQQAVLPVVLRIFVRERMPLPKVILRLEERRHGQRMPRRPLSLALLRLIPLLLLLVLIALISPLTLVLLLGLFIAAFLFVLPILRKRGPQPPVYRRLHRQLPPPGLLSQEQRRKQQWLLLIGFLLGTSISRLPLLSESSAATLQQIPLLRRLTKRWQLHSLPAGILLSLLVLWLLFDDTLVCYGRYLFSFVFGVLTGYGYKLTRIISSYLVVVLGFAALYYVIGHLAPLETLTFSFISFHGYGFFPGNNVLLSKPVAVLAIIEAAIGFFIEMCFIAACISRFIQR